MIEKIRTSRFCKFLAAFISLNLVVETLLPTLAYGLTGGPSQPEVQSFEPIGTTQMVNPFSGDFTYNVPLLDVGGYPVNLSYHSGVGMDQEASWVGLGWNINPGVINRNMRGLPDDFKGDVVKMTNNMKDNMTLKLVASVDLADLIEVFGFSPKKFVKKLDMGFKLGLLYNNYKGVGYEIGTDFTKGPLNLELGFNSQSGIDVNPSITFSKDATVEKNENTFIMKSGATSVSTGFNSRSGLKALSIRSEYSKASTTVTESADGEEVEDDDMDTKIKSSNGSAQISFANSSYMPTLNPNSFSNHYSATVKPGPKFVGVFPNAKITGFFSRALLASPAKQSYHVFTLFTGADTKFTSQHKQLAIMFNTINNLNR